MAAPWRFGPLPSGSPAAARTRRRRDPVPLHLAASYARFSSDLQDASSIDQQRRKCRERAQQDGNTIPPPFEFADEAVSGTRKERAGLNAMLEAARQRRFGTLYVDSLSRLAREFVLTLPMLKELVYNCKVRVVSISEGVDSAHGSWELNAIFRSWMHQEYLTALRAAVLRGQEEAVLNDWSVGDWCFGYASEPIPNSDRGLRGRRARPRKRVVVREDHAQWVRLIFTWFVTERRTLDGIARELSRRGAPKDHRASTAGWHHDYVKRVLRNEKYIGIWPWGKKTNVRNPLTGQIAQEARPPEEAARWVRERPHLRLVEDDVFFQAQAMLDELEATWAAHRNEDGQLAGSPAAGGGPRHLLQGLIRCKECEDTFQVSGAHGKYLGCAGYKKGLCSCKTRLPRRRAEAALLRVIAERVFAQPAWLAGVVEEAQQAWERHRQQTPSALTEVERDLAAVEQYIQRLLDAIEQDGCDGEELRERLRQRRKEKQQLEQRQACLRTAAVRPAEPPARDWVATKLREMEMVLQGAPAEAHAVLRQLVGGAVVVEEAATPGRKRKHLVGRFTLTTRQVLAGLGGAADPSAAALKTEEVVVAFRDMPPWAALAQPVKNRIDAHLGYVAIARELGCPESWVAKALACWHRERGLPVPDGRKMKGRLDHTAATKQKADRAKALWDEDLPMQEIASQMGCCRDTVTALIRSWFESRGLPIPDGRARRKGLNPRSENADLHASE